MILPLVIMQLGIMRDYWGDFSDNAWSVHIHYWTGSIWYFYLIIQPYFATHGHLARHRSNGIIGMFLAGGVSITALSMLHRDIATAELSAAQAERFGPFEPWFFYGVASVELVMMAAFVVAIILAILKRKQLENHAWWLITTVFLIMMPALGRGIQNVYIGMHPKAWPDIDILFPLYLCQLIIIGLILVAAWRYKKFKHPATWLAVAVNLFTMLLLEPLGRSPRVQAILTQLITN